MCTTTKCVLNGVVELATPVQGKRDDASYWTTVNLEAAAESYRAACEDADDVVKKQLETLCKELQVRCSAAMPVHRTMCLRIHLRSSPLSAG